MEQIINLIIQNATIWAPAIAAVVGVITASVGSSKKIKTGLADVSQAAQEIREQQAIKELTAELKALRNDNREMKKQNQQIIEELSRIKKRGDKV